MNGQPIEAVIFDCDGTLVDSETLSIAVLVELVAECGLTLAYEEALQRFSGNELSVVLDSLEQQLGHPLPGDFLNRFRERQIVVLQERVQAVDGAEELLAALSMPFCVASNAPLQKIHVCLETTGLRRFFGEPQILSAYEIQVWKPAPDLFLKAAASLSVAPERCAVVEDSRFGIDAGLAAGMQVFAFDPNGAHDGDDRVHAVRCLRELGTLFGAP